MMTDAERANAEGGAALPVDASRHPLVASLDAALRHRCGVDGAHPLLVAVSGGADSVALLAGCCVLAGRRGSSVARPPVAVHVHHHLRGADADDDAAFVVDLGCRLGVDVHVHHVHPDAGAGNVQHQARALRYEMLAKTAATTGARHVAVAHHADDQLETMLIALGRGAGPDGLSGMRWSRPLSDGVTLVRPLLAVRAADCRDFCTAAGLAWRTDPTNDDPEQVRGRLRRDVLPVLDALWPESAARATAAADALAVAADLLAERVAEAFGPIDTRSWERAALRELPLPIIAAGLRRAAVHAAPDRADAVGQKQVLPAAAAIAFGDEHPRTFDWPGGLVLEVTAREVRLRAPGAPT
jgi:tRNA(Ile)-lysidine synthetase-like protein